MNNVDVKTINDSIMRIHKEYFFLRFKNRLGEFKKNHMFSLLKKNVARLLTIKKRYLKNILL